MFVLRSLLLNSPVLGVDSSLPGRGGMNQKRFNKAKSLKKFGSMHGKFDQRGISADTFHHANGVALLGCHHDRFLRLRRIDWVDRLTHSAGSRF